MAKENFGKALVYTGCACLPAALLSPAGLDRGPKVRVCLDMGVTSRTGLHGVSAPHPSLSSRPPVTVSVKRSKQAPPRCRLRAREAGSHSTGDRGRTRRQLCPVKGSTLGFLPDPRQNLSTGRVDTVVDAQHPLAPPPAHPQHVQLKALTAETVAVETGPLSPPPSEGQAGQAPRGAVHPPLDSQLSHNNNSKEK